MVEAKEQLLYGGGGETVPWRMERRYVEDRWGVAGQGVHFFLFLATFNPTPYNPTKKGFFFGFWGEGFATIEVGLEKGRIGGRIGSHSLEFLGHPTSNLVSNPTPILTKKLLRLWALLTTSRLGLCH